MKRGKIFRKIDVLFLNQLVKAFEEAELKLEQSHGKKDYENFTKSKKFILQIQGKISEVLA